MRRFQAPRSKHLVRVVMVMMLVFMFMAAALVVIVIIMVMMLVFMLMAAALVIVVIVIIMVVMLVFIFMAATLVIVIVVMVMVFVCMFMLVFVIFGKFFQLGVQTILFFHRGKNGFPVQLVPLRRHIIRVGIPRLQSFETSVQLFFGNSRRMRKHHTRSVAYLIDKKLAEIFHIHFALICVHYSAESIQNAVFHVRTLHRAYHVAQFPHARRLDNNPIGSILFFHLLQRLREIAHQRTADTPGIHFGDIHAGIL